MTGTAGETEQAAWIIRPTDHGLEAEMLRRMMVFFGVKDKRAGSDLAKKSSQKRRSQLVRGRNQSELKIDEGFSGPGVLLEWRWTAEGLRWKIGTAGKEFTTYVITTLCKSKKRRESYPSSCFGIVTKISTKRPNTKLACVRKIRLLESPS